MNDKYVVVKNGIVQKFYELSKTSAVVRKDEKYTNFYITANEDVEIEYPDVTNPEDKQYLKTKVRVIGREFTNEDVQEKTIKLLKGAELSTVIEVEHQCLSEGKMKNEI